MPYTMQEAGPLPAPATASPCNTCRGNPYKWPFECTVARRQKVAHAGRCYEYNPIPLADLLDRLADADN